MDTEPNDRTTLRWAAFLLLVGQLLYIVITQFHAGGVANDHPAVFANYADSGIWTGVHVGQFAATTIMLSGLLVLFFALRGAPAALWASRFGAALSVATVALYGLVMAVDGVALKQAVDAWVSAPEAEKAARFASAEAVRWIEWGARSYENFTLGLALLAFAVAVARTAWLARPVAILMGLAGLDHLVQGWIAEAQGFPPIHDTAIVVARILDVAWMTWLLVTVCLRRPDLAVAR